MERWTDGQMGESMGEWMTKHPASIALAPGSPLSDFQANLPKVSFGSLHDPNTFRGYALHAKQRSVSSAWNRAPTDFCSSLLLS